MWSSKVARKLYGSVTATVPLLAKLPYETICIRWPFTFSSNGYGRIYRGKFKGIAHRHVCKLAHGPAPSRRHHAAHNCGNRWCVNPNHLRWATPRQNLADRIIHGTTNRGERHGSAKLTNQQAQEIKFGAGSLPELARRFGVSYSTAHSIRVGRQWAWLEAA